jgi:hypothetical protein
VISPELDPDRQDIGISKPRWQSMKYRILGFPGKKSLKAGYRVPECVSNLSSRLDWISGAINLPHQVKTLLWQGSTNCKNWVLRRPWPHTGVYLLVACFCSTSLFHGIYFHGSRSYGIWIHLKINPRNISQATLRVASPVNFLIVQSRLLIWITYFRNPKYPARKARRTISPRQFV